MTCTARRARPAPPGAWSGRSASPPEPSSSSDCSSVCCSTPPSSFLSAGIAAGLVFSAVTNTCGMAAVLAKLPYNRPRAADLDDTLAALRNR